MGCSPSSNNGLTITESKTKYPSCSIQGNVSPRNLVSTSVASLNSGCQPESPDNSTLTLHVGQAEEYRRLEAVGKRMNLADKGGKLEKEKGVKLENEGGPMTDKKVAFVGFDSSFIGRCVVVETVVAFIFQIIL